MQESDNSEVWQFSRIIKHRDNFSSFNSKYSENCQSSIKTAKMAYIVQMKIKKAYDVILCKKEMCRKARITDDGSSLQM